MACPVPANVTGPPTVPNLPGNGEDNGWEKGVRFQIFANFEEAKVPTGNVEDCYDFQAAVIDWTNEGPAAWQYV